MTVTCLDIRTNNAVAIDSTNGVEQNMEVGSQLKKSVGGLHLVHVARNTRHAELREATTGRPVAVSGGMISRRTVPRIMAVAAPVPTIDEQPVPAQAKVELAFYRKYTEAMLRRYLRLSVEVGRVPSIMGRELFRGNVSHCKTGSLEDGVIFCVDVERCLAKLQQDDLRLLQRIAIQGYSFQEAAPFFGLDFRRCHERYRAALDELTKLLLAGRLLEPSKCCQDVETV